MSSSDIEHQLSGADMEANEPQRVLSTRVQFDVDKVTDRQDAINNILASSGDSEKAVAELNKKVATEWDDDFGISYLSIAGRSLPGLEVHGVAESLTLSACDIPGANFESGRFNAAVFTAANMAGLKARGANFDDTVMPLTDFDGADLRDVTAIEAILNFANMREVQMRGIQLTSAYLLGTEGLTRQMLEEVAELTAARALVPGVAARQTSELMQNTLASSFIGVKAEDDVMRHFDPAHVITDSKLAGILLGKQRTEGVVFDDIILSNSRMVASRLGGSVLHEVHGRDVVMRAVKAAGAVILNSDMQNADLTASWTPGAFIAHSNLGNTLMTMGNSAGAVYYNVDMGGAVTDERNLDGAIVIGGKVPELSELGKHQITIMQPTDVPEKVMGIMQRFVSKAITVKPTTSQPELE